MHEQAASATHRLLACLTMTLALSATAAAGSISQAARLLEISRPTLYDMIRDLGIETP